MQCACTYILVNAAAWKVTEGGAFLPFFQAPNGKALERPERCHRVARTTYITLARRTGTYSSRLARQFGKTSRCIGQWSYARAHSSHSMVLHTGAHPQPYSKSYSESETMKTRKIAILYRLLGGTSSGGSTVGTDFIWPFLTMWMRYMARMNSSWSSLPRFSKSESPQMSRSAS